MEHPLIASDVRYAEPAECLLDVYRPAGAGADPLPVVVYCHGGGWRAGTRADVVHHCVPYLDCGLAAVNVEWRLADQAKAPAGVIDARRAIEWVHAHCDDYGWDAGRIVAAGNSAGAHVAALAAIGTAEAYEPTGFVPDPAVRVAAMCLHAPATDVPAVFAANPGCAEWLPEGDDRDAMAGRLSLHPYVRAGLPATYILIGDADITVLYDRVVAWANEMKAAGNAVTLLTLPGEAHGFKNPAVLTELHPEALAEFLAGHDLLPDPQV